MRILMLSDLHLEVRPFEPADAAADVAVLAGDIANGAAGVEWAQRNFRIPVVYVAGNHEYYDGEFHAVRADMAAAAARSGIEFLDCGETTIDNVRFLGCTLWTDYSLVPAEGRGGVVEEARRKNPDYAKIRFGHRPFAPENAISLCRAHRAWLGERLREAFPGPTVIVTHFAPHPGSIAPAYAGHPANPGFVLDLSSLMGRAALWIHGHTHTAFDYVVSGTRVVCNPRGYPEEATGFAAERVVEV